MLIDVKRKVGLLKDKTRLDNYVVSMGLRLSRSLVQKLIKNGNILLNGKKAKPSTYVKTGDEIHVRYEKMTHFESILPEDIPINIVYEDEHIIVVDKPAGMVVHPAKGNRTGTLVNALMYRTTIEGGDSKERPGVVHRLDKDTSGILVFAKNEIVHATLSKMIEKREVKRNYLCLVWGRMDPNEGTIDAPMGRHPVDRKRMAVTLINSKRAVTHYRVIEYTPIASLLFVSLETGRTHQIRVHVQHRGHPAVGDYDYGGRKRSVLNLIEKKYHHLFEKILEKIDRQALHAAVLSFNHPVTKKKLTFYSPLPQDIRDVLTICRSADYSSNGSK